MSFLASKVWFFIGRFFYFSLPYFPSPHKLAKRVVGVKCEHRYLLSSCHKNWCRLGKAVKVCGEHNLKQGSKPIKIYPKRYPINAYITEIILARIPSSKGTKLKLGNVLKNILSWGCSWHAIYLLSGSYTKVNGHYW